jgi:hypothetical protein
MKTCQIKPILTFLAILTIAFQSCAQDKEKRVSLGGEWRFILGDNMKFAKPEYNDSDWEDIYVPSNWQDEGFRNYSGYAWYRKSVSFDYEKGDALYLELGRIDDVDEVYFNGKLIGTTGGFPPNYFTAYNYHRRYFIPQEYINKTGKNVIAVRVFDEGGEGGIIGSTVGIYAYTNYSDNSLNLFGYWKFRLFDNAEWSKENIDESEWENVVVPASWESQGYREYDGFAWYRKTFKLSADFKTDDLLLLLGKIDDMDEVFINGKYVDGTGNIKRKWASDDEYAKYRTYSIPDGLLKAGEDNVIAVRVYDQTGAGGIYEGPITILPRAEYKDYWRRYRDENNHFSSWLDFFID